MVIGCSRSLQAAENEPYLWAVIVMRIRVVLIPRAWAITIVRACVWASTLFLVGRQRPERLEDDTTIVTPRTHFPLEA